MLAEEHFKTYHKKVHTFQELIETPFINGCNACCWERNMEGNFEEIIQKLNTHSDIIEISEDQLKELELSPQGDVARNHILTDLYLLTDFGAQPVLNIVNRYPKDDLLDFIATDVYSFHVDRSPLLMDTYLCTYFGASSEFITNEDAEKCIDHLEIRKKLKELHQNDEADFETFLTENFFDLHYLHKKQTAPISLEIGHLWRLAVDHPDQKVPPCVHRAPEENNQPRLMIIC